MIKAPQTFVSLNSRLESNKEEEGLLTARDEGADEEPLVRGREVHPVHLKITGVCVLEVCL